MRFAILIMESLTLRKFATKSEMENAIGDCQSRDVNVKAFKYNTMAECWAESEIVI